MAKSKQRTGFTKRKQHNRLLLEHTRHTQQKNMEQALRKLQNKPNNVADLLNKEEEETKLVLDQETNTLISTKNVANTKLETDSEQLIDECV